MKAVCNHFESGRGICEIFALPLSKLTLCCSSQHYRHTKHRSCCCCHINNSHVMRISQLDVGQWMVEVDNNRRDRDLIWLSVSFRARRCRTQKRSIVRLRDKTRNNRAALINGGRQAGSCGQEWRSGGCCCMSFITNSFDYYGKLCWFLGQGSCSPTSPTPPYIIWGYMLS